jgi:hypothetical protein
MDAKEPPKIVITEPVRSLDQWIDLYCRGCNIPIYMWYQNSDVRKAFSEWLEYRLQDHKDGDPIQPLSNREKKDA